MTGNAAEQGVDIYIGPYSLIDPTKYVYTGFWANGYNEKDDEWDVLSRHMPSAIGKDHQYTLTDFLHGYCGYYAVALQKVLGYPAYCIWEHDEDENEFVHAFCEVGDYVVDVRGVTTDWESFLDEFDDFIFDRRDMDIQPFDHCFEDDDPVLQTAIQCVLALKENYVLPNNNKKGD